MTASNILGFVMIAAIFAALFAGMASIGGWGLAIMIVIFLFMVCALLNWALIYEH